MLLSTLASSLRCIYEEARCLCELERLYGHIAFNQLLFLAASQAPLLDIMLLIDGSGSVGRRDFVRVKNWVIAISSHFNIADNSTRIGVVQYSLYFPNQ